MPAVIGRAVYRLGEVHLFEESAEGPVRGGRIQPIAAVHLVLGSHQTRGLTLSGRQTNRYHEALLERRGPGTVGVAETKLHRVHPRRQPANVRTAEGDLRGGIESAVRDIERSPLTLTGVHVEKDFGCREGNAVPQRGLCPRGKIEALGNGVGPVPLSVAEA
jgi:hypothetical protein